MTTVLMIPEQTTTPTDSLLIGRCICPDHTETLRVKYLLEVDCSVHGKLVVIGKEYPL
jgi:hypothetical protein